MLLITAIKGVQTAVIRYISLWTGRSLMTLSARTRDGWCLNKEQWGRGGLWQSQFGLPVRFPCTAGCTRMAGSFAESRAAVRQRLPPQLRADSSSKAWGLSARWTGNLKLGFPTLARAKPGSVWDYLQASERVKKMGISRRRAKLSQMGMTCYWSAAANYNEAITG